MEMKELNTDQVCIILNEIMEYEMAGVIRYTHSSLMVTGPNRIPIVAFLQEQATESLQHALIVLQILEESLAHELNAVSLYKALLDAVSDASIYLEEYARGQIGQEEQHALELKKMLKDFS
jgi:bacterioferritin